MPAYYDLWAASAGNNPDFDFLIFSDLPFPTDQYPNIKIIPITFQEFKNLATKKIQMDIVLETPYKLCDYKPAYGYILEEYLTAYDFWGFCDMDLIFGNIGNFIDDDLLEKYDKILYQGHFTLNRNNPKMNQMFLRTFSNVIDYKFSFSTPLDCHFDENGTLAYCNEYDSSIRFYFRWIFMDTDVLSYQLSAHGTEAMLIWERGKLMMYWNGGKESEEMMYVHLQKRAMYREFDGVPEKIAIMRNVFMCADMKSPADFLQIPVDQIEKKKFNKQISKKMKQFKFQRLKNGWVKMKLCSKIYNWRGQKDLRCTQ